MDKIFIWISRTNSILLLLLLVGAGGVAIWKWSRADLSRSQQVAVATEPGRAGRTSARLVLGDVETITGSDTLMISLGLMLPSGFTAERMKLTSGPRYRQETRNILFLGGNSRYAAWLFKTNSNFLRDLDQVNWKPNHDSENPTMALYFEFAAADTNGDQEINREDRFTVALAKPDGSGVSEILHDVTRVLSHDLVDKQTLALVYQIEKTIWHARYRTDTFEKVSEQAVIDIPESL
jgi:hypothetical protein